MRTWNRISIQSARKSADEFVIISVDPEVIERCTGKSIMNGHGKIIDKNCGFSSKLCLIEGLSATNNHSECLLSINGWLPSTIPMTISGWWYTYPSEK